MYSQLIRLSPLNELRLRVQNGREHLECCLLGNIFLLLEWQISYPPGIRTSDLPAHSLFFTRPQIVSCRHYCFYHCDLNVEEWWTSEQIKNTYCCHWHTFAEYTAFAIHSSCVWKHQWKTKHSALRYPVPSPCICCTNCDYTRLTVAVRLCSSDSTDRLSDCNSWTWSMVLLAVL